MADARTRPIIAALAVMAGLLTAAGHARADFKLCNRMSYVLDAALAVESQGTAMTRGWFRLDPGACKVALQGEIAADRFYVHARIPPIYGSLPLTPGEGTNFCVGSGDFTIREPRNCRFGQSVAAFFPVRPSEGDGGLAAYLAEDSEYTDAQARDAGIQRLLVIAGYDANPIDGIRGDKTDAALLQFLQDNRLPPTAAGRTDFFNVLLDVAQKPGIGLSWCNDTTYPVMAAIAAEDKNSILTRGWYRVEPGKCVRPDIVGRPLRLYSFAEAVDPDGQPIRRGDKSVSWGGDITLCTRNAKFELNDRTDCAAKGLSANGFAPVDFAGKTSAVVRFR